MPLCTKCLMWLFLVTSYVKYHGCVKFLPKKTFLLLQNCWLFFYKTTVFAFSWGGQITWVFTIFTCYLKKHAMQSQPETYEPYVFTVGNINIRMSVLCYSSNSQVTFTLEISVSYWSSYKNHGKCLGYLFFPTITKNVCFAFKKSFFIF